MTTNCSQSIALFAEINVRGLILKHFKNKFKNAMEKRLIFMIDLFIFLKVVFDNNKGNSFSDMWQKLTIV